MPKQFDMQKFLKENKIVLREFEGVPADKLDDKERELLAAIGNWSGMTGGPMLDADNIVHWNRTTAIAAIKKMLPKLNTKAKMMAKKILHTID